MEATAVFRDDARGDGQAQASATVLGREMWQKEFVFGCGEAHKLREFVDQGGKRSNLPFNQTRTLLNEVGQFRVRRSPRLRQVAFLQETRKPLRRKLDGR